MRILDLFSGIGGFALAAEWVWGDDLEIVAFVEKDKFCQKILNKHWPDVPIVEDVRNITIDTLASICDHKEKKGANYGAQEQQVQAGGVDVRSGVLDSEPGRLLRDHAAGDVGHTQAEGLRVSATEAKRESQSLLPWDEGERQGPEPTGGSDGTRDGDPQDALREVRRHGNIQGRQDKDTGAPQRLQQAARGGVPLPEVPSRMAQETPSGGGDVNGWAVSHTTGLDAGGKTGGVRQEERRQGRTLHGESSGTDSENGGPAEAIGSGIDLLTGGFP